MIYYLALGSNLGDRHANITGAVGFLNTLGTVSALSSIHETEPVGMAPGTGKFYNLAAALESKLSPLSLLKILKNF
ncbi:MAG: 2-amino-4-hydroxy-6-hydroxymethyldihydropteridine diphosphokinase, partial [bacterium]|nr:2-amino-4-hydroxy-6-hydroxymethyldihydropteridine diphosphokinase [bacterium]